MTKDVALVLSSGGPRGFAYIGAIEELLEQGYNITSVAGTSIGSLIGGMYASGKLAEVKEWLFSLDAWKVFTLMDFSISMNHLVKGDKVIEALKGIVPDMNIEDLNIPYKAIASDLYTGEEIIFDKGNLYQAIRASISIPSLFRPVKYGNRTLIDGGIVNTMPLNRVDRNGHDILVAFNVNAVDVDEIRSTLEDEERLKAEKEAEKKARTDETKAVLDSVRHDSSMSVMEKIRLAGSQGQKILKHAFTADDQTSDIHEIERNYYTILSRTFDLMNHVNTDMAIKMTPPDILVNMPFDAFGDISDYARAKEISEAGRALMRDALQKYQ